MSQQPESSQPLELAPSAQKLWTTTFIVLTVSYFLLFLCLQMLLSPLPTYAKERFHPGDFTVSLTTSVFALAAIASRFLTAALMRRTHRTVLLFSGIFIAAAATAAYPFAGSIQALLALRILFGIGFGSTSTIMPTLVSQIIPSSRIGEGIGYFGLSTSLAMSFGPMIGLSVLDEYGFGLLATLGTVSVVLTVPLLLGFRSIPPQSHGQARPDAKASVGAKRKTPFNVKLLLPALLNALFSVTYGGLLSFLALYGKEVHLNHIGLFFLFNVITVLIIRPISGRLFDSRGHSAVLIPAALIIFASLTLLSFTTSLPLLIVSALLYGLGFGAIQPTLQAWMLRDSAPEQHGTANSLYYNALDFGVAIGAMVLGLIASGTSYAVMYRYSALFMVLFLIVYVVFQLVSVKKNKPATAS
ncbi:MFS transporter [Paenibacillus allorhizosphaerae]|uniref:MFS-type transporter YfcJ n=1 Tax=Paenibacillus allorhizosphaerae TaxID=2849866 RepID=A0ABM8VK82_9BACL|nr:MFS transporter [Paenibacillus allorhizosphaerae]CAG7646616.1 putative MFS-type transporter YfcJ [Paenibacillus allorhizosphaerae]